MRNVSPKPKWWQLYLTFPVIMGLLLLDSRLRLASGEQAVLQIGIVLLEAVLVEWWLSANASALRHLEDETDRPMFTVIEILSKVSHDQDERPSSPVMLPPREIRGVLDTTFQVDFGSTNPARPGEAERISMEKPS